MIKHINDLGRVVATMTEGTTLLMIFFKIGSYRLNRKRLHCVLMDIERDYDLEMYKTPEEKLAFLKYNRMTKRFIKTAMPVVITAAILYYLSPLINELTGGRTFAGNVSVTYVTPYQVYLFFEIKDLQIYALVYLFQVFIVPLVIFGYTGTDCFLITLVLHVCGQFSVLAVQVKNVLMDPCGHRHGMNELVLKHLRLIRLAKNLDKAFNMLLLPQLFGISIILCLVGYNVIAYSRNTEQGINFLIYVLYALCMLSVLFGYCFVGECLIYESTSFGDALYNCEWYDIPSKQAKLFLVCMCQAQKPLELTAGRFYVFSLQKFTDVLKTSMAYLSVLRTFL
uniref:Odorant receptor 26 n=1 Tax=Sirex noctilio TaxID=36765 RepID=A0A857N544_9HYME|nr:odorant receptor 26 [Sirex noctilio]